MTQCPTSICNRDTACARSPAVLFLARSVTVCMSCVGKRDLQLGTRGRMLRGKGKVVLYDQWHREKIRQVQRTPCSKRCEPGLREAGKEGAAGVA